MAPVIRTVSICSAVVLALTACGGPSEADLLASGQAHLKQHDTAAAVIQFKNALAKNPQSARARLLLGRALLESGDPVAAAVELRKAREAGASDDEVLPQLARAMLASGEEARVIANFGTRLLSDPTATADLLVVVAGAHLRQNDIDKARSSAQAARRSQPQHVPALVLEARLLAADGDFDGALARVDEAIARASEDESAGILRAQLLWHGRQDGAGATDVLRKVLAAHPKSSGARGALITMLFQQGRTDEVKSQLEQLRKLAPSHPETVFHEAQLAFAERDYGKAREFADAILKVAPDSVRVLELAGAAEFRLGNLVQAEALLARALKGDPSRLPSRQLLAQSFLRSGQAGKAVEVLQPVIDGKDADATSLSLAGEAFLQLGEVRRSDAAFQRAGKAAPGDTGIRTAAAVAQMARGNIGVATSELQAIVADDQGGRADLALVSAYVLANDLPAALKALDSLDRKAPQSPVAPHLRGRLLLLKNDQPAATRAFEAALARDPKFYPAVASLATLDFAQGKPEAAKQRLETFLKSDPRSHQAMLMLAELHARSGGAPAEVLGRIREAIKLNPTVASLHVQLVDQFLNAADARQALQAAQSAAAVLPNDLSVQDALGRAQTAAGDGQQAVSTFRRLAALQPDSAMVQVRLANAYNAARDLGNAERALKKALELQPGLLAAHRGLVAVAMLQGRPQEGLSVARALQKSQPRAPDGYSLEGDVEVTRRNFAAAAAAYRAALQRAPSSDSAIKLYSALVGAGKAADAERWAATWLRDHPRDPAFLYFLGDVALAKDQHAEAEKRYREVLEIQPNNALAMNNVAWLMVRQGKSGALALAERANLLFPDRAPLLDTLAAALAAEKQVKKAIETQKRAVARDAQDPALRLHLARLLIQDNQKSQARTELEALARLGDRFADQAEVTALMRSL